MKIPLVRKKDPLIGKLKLLDEAGTASMLNELRSQNYPAILGFLNQHGYNVAQQHPQIYESFSQVNYLLRDGVGIKMACWFNGINPKANLNGSDFIPKLIEHFAADASTEYEFFSMGTKDPWLSDGSRNLFGDRPFHAIDGFQSPEDYSRFFKARHTTGRFPIIVLAMGMPKQEQVAVHLQEELGIPALLICGGAILDFSAQRFPRAPLLVRKFGLEWAFRMLIEPRRLFSRYALGIPLFFYYLSRNAFSKREHTDNWRPCERKN